jgi:hypothetical protein
MDMNTEYLLIDDCLSFKAIYFMLPMNHLFLSWKPSFGLWILFTAPSTMSLHFGDCTYLISSFSKSMMNFCVKRRWQTWRAFFNVLVRVLQLILNWVDMMFKVKWFWRKKRNQEVSFLIKYDLIFVYGVIRTFSASLKSIAKLCTENVWMHNRQWDYWTLDVIWKEIVILFSLLLSSLRSRFLPWSPLLNLSNFFRRSEFNSLRSMKKL